MPNKTHVRTKKESSPESGALVISPSPSTKTDRNSEENGNLITIEQKDGVAIIRIKYNFDGFSDKRRQELLDNFQEIIEITKPDELLKKQDLDNDDPDKKDKPEAPSEPDLTVRGTRRVRKPKRSRSELGSDPNAEHNKLTVKLGSRVPPEIKARFQALASGLPDKSEGALLAEALEDIIEKYEREPT